MTFVQTVLNVAGGTVGFVRRDYLTASARIGLTVMTLGAGSAWSCKVVEGIVATPAVQLSFFVSRETTDSLNTKHMQGVKLFAAPLVFAVAGQALEF